MASFSVTVAMGQDYLPGRLALAAGLMIGFGAIGSAPPGLALFGAIADAAGREAAIWGIAALPARGRRARRCSSPAAAGRRPGGLMARGASARRQGDLFGDGGRGAPASAAAAGRADAPRERSTRWSASRPCSAPRAPCARRSRATGCRR